ncbi:multiple sugar transport system permease protein [Pseudobutyrivibrio sp. YE44]|uniref:carbohydrate ABC transporter permease n=1 Tax=Pseudobutyrivibrio sp. YE44 TaxID=1520802 RepID=UPI00088DD3EE|nr:carbohydrate ABC transporter permease [Pseudobutyrivibrio sp. YE44]SDB19550.1 multiple sugar transport system permease protein [Pseudobutyrivibrio sp. YE44]
MTNKIKKGILYIALVALALSCLLPFWLMIVNSTRSGVEITHSFSFIPGHSLRDNWIVLFDYVNLFTGFFNSLKVAVPATLLTAYFSAITAYAMAMYEWKGNSLLFKVIVVFMMIPSQLSLIGFYNLCQKLRLIDSYVPLIVPAIAAPGIVFFLRQYTKSTLSKALLEAARIDGASEILTFHKIVLPIMSPGIATMSIGAFIGNWNSYLVPLILLNTPKKMTLPVMISTLNAATDLQKNQGAIYLGVAISVVPIMIVFSFCSKYIISSISAGGVKE